MALTNITPQVHTTIGEEAAAEEARLLQPKGYTARRLTTKPAGGWFIAGPEGQMYALTPEDFYAAVIDGVWQPMPASWTDVRRACADAIAAAVAQGK